MPHLIVVPILLPMAVAAVMLLLGEGRLPLKAGLGMGSGAVGLAVSCVLLGVSHERGVVAYLPGNWPTPFGIALAMDRLSATMLVLTWIVGTTALLFASARWDRAGIHFHPLVQLQLMGLSGAFLTADVFNLFVFFEILLAASYGLLLHGSGRARVRASVRYVAVNLAASSLFLIGVAIIYGVTGTLNMAELAARSSDPSVGNRHLIDTGAAILAVAFLIKAGAWPLNFWLAPAYAAATPPAAAMFALLTKVGIYALVRVWTLMFAGGPLGAFGADVMLGCGIVTTLLAATGMLASYAPAVQVAWAVVVSAGTILAAVGLADEKVLAGGLFYLVPSTIAASASFLLLDLIQRWQAGTTIVADAPFLNAALEDEDVNLDDEGKPLVALPFPASTAFLGLGFMACALLLAGFPPLPTFLGKLGMLSAAIDAAAVDAEGGSRIVLFVAAVLVSGVLVLVASMRTGIRIFWTQTRHRQPRVRAAEGMSFVALLVITALVTAAAGPGFALASAAARSLYDRSVYVEAVLGAPVRASPSQSEAP
jgi:multicomponent K+:H+ antiporter subunit D